MDNPFVKTETKEVKTINYVKDGDFSNGARISVVASVEGRVAIVIGASYEDKSACCFGKGSLLELAETLKEIAEAL